MRLTELVLCDVVLAAAVGGLLYYDSQSSLETRPAEDASQDEPEETGTKTRTDDPKTRKTPETEPAERAELAKLKKEASSKDPVQALQVYERASARLRGSEVWKGFWSRERSRLLGRVRARDLARSLRAEIQLAADNGRADLVQQLLTRANRPGKLLSEVAWAQRARNERQLAKPVKKTAPPKKTGGGLVIKGINPEKDFAKGKSCVVDCGLGTDQGEQLRDAIDAVAARAERLLEARLTRRLRVKVLTPSAPYVREPGVAVTRQRPGEKLEVIRERLELLTARWVTRTLLKTRRLSGWRLAFSRVLTSVTTEGGLTPVGAARRRLFLAAPPDGQGNALSKLAGRPDDPEDPAGARASALVHFALYGDAASDLRGVLLDVLRGRRKLTVWLTSTRAIGLESVWVKHMERAK